MTKTKINLCRECGSDNISVGDCGYSSFNVGWAVCKNCGYEVRVSPCGCFPREDIIRIWNRKNTDRSKVADSIRKIANQLLKLADSLADELEK